MYNLRRIRLSPEALLQFPLQVRVLLIKLRDRALESVRECSESGFLA
jgi:hypothetical protein